MRNLLKQQRLIDKLNYELGPALLSYLAHPDITELSLNPDGKIWIKDVTEGYRDSNQRMDTLAAYSLIGTLADYSGTIVNEQQAILEAELSTYGCRIEALLPPIVSNPSFTIRKQCQKIYTLEEYYLQGVINSAQLKVIMESIHSGCSLIIAGGPGSGKTTFANALLHQMAIATPQHRFIVIEDTRELQCSAKNTLLLKTTSHVDHDQLLRVSLRLSPDRITLGECRGKEMFTLLKAWNTGTHGGLATLHSNSARSAVQRIVDMANESGLTPSPSLICESIQLIIALGFDEQGNRKVNEMVKVTGYQEGDYVLKAY